MRCPRCGWKFNTLTAEKVKDMQKAYAKAYSPWAQEDDELLSKMFEEDTALVEMSKVLQRQPSAVRARIELLDLRKKPEPPAPAPEQKDYLT